MRKAMANAEVGDDVYGDDPTVNKLEEKAAEMFGKEDAVFVSSGTQGNLVSILSQATRGDEILIGDICHIFSSEGGGVSVLGGVVMYPLKTNSDGTIDEENILELNLLTLEVATNFLDSNGVFIVKTFQNSNLKKFRKEMEKDLKIVQTAKPAASKKQSKEIYLYGIK